MEDIVWKDIRSKTWQGWIYCFYVILWFTMLIFLTQNFNFKNIISVIYAISLCIYLFIKSFYTLGGEPQEKCIWFLKYINACEYMLFIIANLFIFTVDHDKSIEKVIWFITVIVDVDVAVTILIILCAMIHEYRGYNIRLKHLFFDILNFEILVLQFVILTAMIQSTKTSLLDSTSISTLTDDLLPMHETEMSTVNDNDRERLIMVA